MSCVPRATQASFDSPMVSFPSFMLSERRVFVRSGSDAVKPGETFGYRCMRHSTSSRIANCQRSCVSLSPVSSSKIGTTRHWVANQLTVYGLHHYRTALNGERKGGEDRPMPNVAMRAKNVKAQVSDPPPDRNEGHRARSECEKTFLVSIARADLTVEDTKAR